MRKLKDRYIAMGAMIANEQNDKLRTKKCLCQTDPLIQKVFVEGNAPSLMGIDCGGQPNFYYRRYQKGTNGWDISEQGKTNLSLSKNVQRLMEKTSHT